jgi:hypothetical protein
MTEVEFPTLAVAARMLGLDDGALAEAILSGMDSGLTEREATVMTIVELLQRKGAYHGKLKAAIDSGAIFIAKANDANCGRSGGHGQMAKIPHGQAAPSSRTQRKGNKGDDEC